METSQIFLTARVIHADALSISPTNTIERIHLVAYAEDLFIVSSKFHSPADAGRKLIREKVTSQFVLENGRSSLFDAGDFLRAISQLRKAILVRLPLE
jgi:hypothetical protein